VTQNSDFVFLPRLAGCGGNPSSTFAGRPFLSTSGGRYFRLHDAVHIAEVPLQKPILQKYLFFESASVLRTVDCMWGTSNEDTSWET
jgi:hypothetical protein